MLFCVVNFSQFWCKVDHFFPNFGQGTYPKIAGKSRRLTFHLLCQPLCIDYMHACSPMIEIINAKVSDSECIIISKGDRVGYHSKWIFIYFISSISLKIEWSFIGPVKQSFKPKIAIIFLPISLNISFGCSKEPSHRDGSFEYPQHMFWLIFWYALLSWGLWQYTSHFKEAWFGYISWRFFSHILYWPMILAPPPPKKKKK